MTVTVAQNIAAAATTIRLLCLSNANAAAGVDPPAPRRRANEACTTVPNLCAAMTAIAIATASTVNETASPIGTIGTATGITDGTTVIVTATTGAMTVSAIATRAGTTGTVIVIVARAAPNPSSARVSETVLEEQPP